jgi:hypothetical protein
MSRTPLDPRPLTSRTRTAAVVAIVTAGTAAAALLVLHLLRPDLDPTWRFVSEYALGPFGFVMTVAFLAIAAASAGLVALMWGQARTVTGRIGAVLAAISGLGMLIAAVFPTDPITTPADEATLSGTLHLVGGQLNLTPFAILLLTIGLRSARDWRPVLPALWAIVAVDLAVTVGFVATAATATDGFGPGVLSALLGRGMLAAYLAWVVVAASHALRLPRAASGRADAASRPRADEARPSTSVSAAG